MKKVYLSLAAMAIVFGLAACAKTTDTSDTETTPPAAETPAVEAPAADVPAAQ